MEVELNSLIADIVQIHAQFGVSASNIEDFVRCFYVLVQVTAQLWVFAVPI